MHIDYKKLLPATLRNTRWGQLIEAYQSIMENDIKNKVIYPIKDQYNFEKMTTTEKMKLCSMFGYKLLRYNGYTSTNEYLNKNLATLVQRILWKNTERGYQYIFYNYFAKGHVWPTIYNYTENYYQPIDLWNKGYESANISLDFDLGLTLDDDEENFKILDEENKLQIPLTRVIVFAIEFLQTEDQTQFLSEESLLALTNDLNQMKRITERFIYEPLLTIFYYPDQTVYQQEYSTYDKSGTTYIESILTSGNTIYFPDIEKIQFGDGSHELTDGMFISGVANLVETLTSGQIQQIIMPEDFTIGIRKKLYSSDQDHPDFTEIAFLDINDNCFFYSKLPYVHYPKKTHHGFFFKLTTYQTFLVTFNSMGGSPVESKRVKMNTPVEEPEEPVKPGYIFDGWYTGQLYLTRWNFTNNVLFNMTLYAKWIEL